MKIRILILFFLIYKIGFSQTLISDAIKVKTAFDNLYANINSKELERDYIAAFPSDTNSFLKVFQAEKFDQLYKDSYKYIDALKKCATTFPKEVISKCVDIGKDLIYKADAVGQLQHISVELAINHVNVFLNKYKTLDVKEQNHLINFYADVENHNAFHEYQELINKLNSIGEKGIAKKLEVARENRRAKQDHGY